MQTLTIISRALRALVSCVALACASPGQAETFSAQTGLPGSGANISIVGLANIANKYTSHSLGVNAGLSGSQFMVALGRGEAQFASVVYGLAENMANRTGPFAKLGNAPELWANARMLFGFTGGYVHFLTYADSGIETFGGLKGRTVYMGPPNAALVFAGAAVVEAASGLKAGTDYEVAALDLQGGNQAFADGKIDMLVQPAPLGGALIEQYGASRKIRLLGLTDAAIENLIKGEHLKVLGRSIAEIPPGTYTGQVNEEPVKTTTFLQGVGANKDVNEEAIYEIVTALLTHLDEYRLNSKAMFGALTKESMIESLPGPLHAGAVRAYRDAGVTVPDELLPPEMK